MADSGVLLPCHDNASWEEDKTVFNLLSNVHSLREFSELRDSHAREDSPLRARLERFSGLLIFLDQYCTEEERAAFFELTLPFIINAAVCLKERVPESGVPFLRRQECVSLVLGRQLVVSLLANAFLCTFPDHSVQSQKDEGGEDEEPFTFLGLYDKLQQSVKNPTGVAAKLKCILAYFRRLAENKCDLSGAITVKRQVLALGEVPSLATWRDCQSSLCSVSVDNSRGIEDAGSHTLQVDFANRRVSGSTLGGGCVQEEIRFSICPELLVSRLVLEPLEDNEAVIITGAERFANYKGYGKTLQYDREHIEQSNRDMFGNILTSVVAIDAVPFLNPLSPEDQFTDQYLLRELNKAFAGFLCQQDRGDRTTELIALRVQNDSTQLLLSENHPPPLSFSLGFYTASVPASSVDESVPPFAGQQPHAASAPSVKKSSPETLSPLSPIQEISESRGQSLQPDSTGDSKPSPSISVELPVQLSISNLVNNIVQSGVELATTNGRGCGNEGEKTNADGKGQKRVMEDYASNLTSGILSSVFSQPTSEGEGVETTVKVETENLESVKDESDSGRGGGGVGEYVGKLTESLLSGVLFKSSEQTRPTMNERENGACVDVAEKLAKSLFSEIPSRPSKSETSEEESGAKNHPSSSATDTADKLAHSIVLDVLSKDGAVPNSPPVPPQTVGQPTSPEWRVHSYADQVADGIISSLLEDKRPPSMVQNRQSGSMQSSRSSSLTGQTITLHEFTDDLVEGVMREGLLIASLQARGTERADLGEGGGSGGCGDEKDTLDSMQEDRGEEGEEGHVSEKEKLRGERSASDLAEFLVTQSIRSVLEDGRKNSGEKERDSISPRPFSGGSKRAESPMRPSGKPSLLRHTLEKPKFFASFSSETDVSELEQSMSSSLHHLAAPSSRTSYAWSVASTRDEESRPVSPTDLDRMALSFVGSMEEYCSMFAELVIRSAIAEVTGKKEYICHVPVKAHSHSESLYTTGDIRIQVPTVYSHHDYSHHDERHSVNSRMDTFLRTLDVAEPFGRGDVGEGRLEEEGEREFSERSPTMHKGMLRPVATGNWGCGVFGGDPQLKSMLQWAAVSASGRPEMVYFPFSDRRMEQLTHVTSHLLTKQWTVGQLLSTVVEYCHLSKEERGPKTLFSALLEQQ